MRKSRENASYRHTLELSTTVELRICGGHAAAAGEEALTADEEGNFANEPQSLGAWTTPLFPSILTQRHFFIK